MSCPHPLRQANLVVLQDKLKEDFDRDKTDPKIRQILMALIAKHNPEVKFNLRTLPAEYMAAYRRQVALGPNAPFFGYFTTELYKLQEKYLGSTNQPNGTTQARTALQRWTVAFLEAAYQAWNIRNSHLHVEDPNAGMSFKRCALLVECRELLEKKYLMVYSDQPSMDRKPMEDLAELPTPELEHWYKTMKPWVLQSIKLAAAQAKHGNHLITSFFPQRNAAE